MSLNCFFFFFYRCSYSVSDCKVLVIIQCIHHSFPLQIHESLKSWMALEKLVFLSITHAYVEGQNEVICPTKSTWYFTLCQHNDIAWAVSVASVCPSASPRARHLKWIWVTVGSPLSTRWNLEAFSSFVTDLPELLQPIHVTHFTDSESCCIMY